MAWIHSLPLRVRALLHKRAVETDLDDEVRFHIDMETAAQMKRGVAPEEARLAATRMFGGVERFKEECRDERGTRPLEELAQDLTYGVRSFRKSPGFSFIAMLTLAVGIGATTAIFSAVHAVVLRSLPFADPDRVVRVSGVWRGEPGAGTSAGNFVDTRTQSTSFEHLAAVQYSSFNLAEGDAPERIVGARVSRGFFSIFGVRPLLGRVLLDEEDQPGREQVVVLSHKLWTRRFGADPAIIGREVPLSSRPYTVVGVMPPSFDLTVESEDLWVPIAFTPERMAMHDEHYLTVYGLLKRGVSLERAQRDLDAVVRVGRERYPQENSKWVLTVQTFATTFIGDYRQRLLILLGAVGFVLLIACGNVANLLLARGATRQKEIAIRTALGAGRGRIVRQLLTESVVLGLAGAIVGIALAYWGVSALVSASPPGVPRLEQARVDGVVLGFTLLVALASSLVFGLIPALRVSRPNLQGVLKEGGRSSAAGAPRDRVRSGLVIGEVALALTLLVGAGLLIRSALQLQSVRPGFDPSGVLSARVALPKQQFEEATRVQTAFHQMVDALQRAPGVRSAAVVSQTPLTGGGGSNGLVPEGKTLSLENAINSQLRIITPDYLKTMRIPLLSGRAFTAQDIAGENRVMIISERLAREAYPGQDPIGKRMSCCEGAPDDPRWKTVVGVVGNVRWRSLAEEASPEFYLPIDQVPAEAWDWVQRSMTLVARTDGNAEMLTAAMRDAVRSVDPGLPLYSVATMEQRMSDSLAQDRFNTLLLGLLGAIGLLLAAVGIYGVIAYFVSQRTQEIGVRMALGATAGNVLSLMARQGMRPVVIGVALGVLTALAATRVLRGSLYGIGANDPFAFLAAVLVLMAVGVFATYLPARRATRVDPTTALRGE